jgi:hypothetical protein
VITNTSCAVHTHTHTHTHTYTLCDNKYELRGTHTHTHTHTHIHTHIHCVVTNMSYAVHQSNIQFPLFDAFWLRFVACYLIETILPINIAGKVPELSPAGETSWVLLPAVASGKRKTKGVCLCVCAFACLCVCVCVCVCV